jgi:hypothetical protein
MMRSSRNLETTAAVLLTVCHDGCLPIPAAGRHLERRPSMPGTIRRVRGTYRSPRSAEPLSRAQRSTSPVERSSGDRTDPGGDAAGLYLHPGARRRPSAIAGHGQFARQGQDPYRLCRQITSNRQGLPVRAPDSLRRPHRGLRRTDLATRRAGARIPWASPGQRHHHLHRLRSRHDDPSQCPQVAVRSRQQRGGITVLRGIRTPDGPVYPLPVLVTQTARTPGSTGNE